VKISKGSPGYRAVCLKWLALTADEYRHYFLPKNNSNCCWPLMAFSDTRLHDFPDLMRAGRSIRFDKVFW
jgi:hypothetical protein